MGGRGLATGPLCTQPTTQLPIQDRQQWQDRTRQQRFQYLISEIGELSTELVKLEWEGQDIAQLKQNIGHEMYDVVWNICDLANLLELDLLF